MQKKAIQLMRLVWSGNGTSSWGALNNSMADAMKLAIGSKMVFDISALREIQNSMRPGDWMGENGWEGQYAFAVAVENQTFIEAYEKWRKRAPFFANNIRTVGCGGYAHVCLGGRRQRGRIALGTEIGNWQQKVTSIGQNHIILCHYKNDLSSPIKREKLAREDIAKRWPAPKKYKKKTAPKLLSIEEELKACRAAIEAYPNAKWFWCIHHAIHVEKASDEGINARINFIMTSKTERAARLRNLRPVLDVSHICGLGERQLRELHDKEWPDNTWNGNDIF